MRALVTLVALLSCFPWTAGAQEAPDVSMVAKALAEPPRRQAALRLSTLPPYPWPQPPVPGAAAQPAAASSAARFTKTDRVVAAAAGGLLGFFVGARLGWIATSRPNDDVAGLRGVVVGAPVGALAGAVVGLGLTR